MRSVNDANNYFKGINDAFWNAANTLNVFMLTLETTPMGAFVDLPCCD